MRTLTACLLIATVLSGSAIAQDNDGEVRLSLIAHLNIELIERCGYAQGTPYSDVAYATRDYLRRHLSPEAYQDGGRASQHMDLNCGESNHHVRRLLRAEEKFNSASEAEKQRIMEAFSE